MGGFFSPTPAPAPQVIGGTPPALGPFQTQLVQAISSLFPGFGGVTPLEESTIRGTFMQAQPGAQALAQTAGGGFLPGTPGGQQNPFLQNLIGGIEAQGDIARRQLGSAAQRAGMLSSTDYLNQSNLLEQGLAQRRGETLAGLYEAERGRQMQAPSLGLGLAQGLTQLAGYPRQVAEQATYRPLELGMNLLSGGAGRGQVVQPQVGPSPFASLIGGLAPWAGLFKF